MALSSGTPSITWMPFSHRIGFETVVASTRSNRIGTSARGDPRPANPDPSGTRTPSRTSSSIPRAAVATNCPGALVEQQHGGSLRVENLADPAQQFCEQLINVQRGQGCVGQRLKIRQLGLSSPFRVRVGSYVSKVVRGFHFRQRLPVSRQGRGCNLFGDVGNSCVALSSAIRMAERRGRRSVRSRSSSCSGSVPACHLLESEFKSCPILPGEFEEQLRRPGRSTRLRPTRGRGAWGEALTVTPRDGHGRTRRRTSIGSV